MTSENIENIKKLLKLQEEALKYHLKLLKEPVEQDLRKKTDITSENVGLGSKLQT